MEVSSSMKKESRKDSDASSPFDNDGPVIDYVPPDPRKSSIKLDSLMKTDFERFLDEILELYKLAPFKKKTRFLDWLVEKSELSQIDMLWSALQFSCHREFFYLGQLKYPEFRFQKLSFPLKQQYKAVSRERSAYIARKEDALRLNQEYFHKPDSYFANEENEEEEDGDGGGGVVVAEKRGKIASSNLFRKHIEQQQQTSNRRSDIKLPLIESKRSLSRRSSDLRKGSTPVFAKSNDFEVRSRQFVRTYGLEWNDDQRNLFIRQLIPILDPRHQYFMLGLLMSRKYKDFIKLLPKSLALRILANLTSRDLDRAAHVSPVWGDLCRSEDLWRFKIGNVDVSSLMIYSNLADWRKLFDRLDALKNNWKEGKFKIVTLKGHREGVTCLTIDGNLLATGSLDKTIKVWSIKDAKLIATMQGHLKGVWCMRFLTRNLLCSGSYDFSIKIWNLVTFTCSRTLYSHTGPVWQICISQSCLVSASKDRTAKVWDMTCCTVLFTLHHKEPVYCVDAQDNVIVTGSGDQLLKLWDKTTGVCYKTVYLGTKDILTGVSLDRGYIAVSSNQLILVLKLEKKGDKINAEEIQRYKEHLKRIESIRLKMIDPEMGDGLIISGSQDGFIKYYDISQPKSVHTFDVHDKRSINSIYFDDYIIASASGDNHIKLLNFAVPNVVKNSEPVNQSQ